MTTSPTLLSLAGSASNLTGPCRETDGDIAAALALHPTGWRRGVKEASATAIWFNDATGQSWPAPYYTASLDAAMTLVPEGPPTLIRDGYDDALGDKRPYAHVMNEIGEGYAATKALAIVVAALRARAALEGDHG